MSNFLHETFNIKRIFPMLNILKSLNKYRTHKICEQLTMYQGGQRNQNVYRFYLHPLSLPFFCLFSFLFFSFFFFCRCTKAKYLIFPQKNLTRYRIARIRFLHVTNCSIIATQRLRADSNTTHITRTYVTVSLLKLECSM